MDNAYALKLTKVCEQVKADIENDVKEMDGKPFNGKTVATQLGNQAAAINALADVLMAVIANTPKT